MPEQDDKANRLIKIRMINGEYVERVWAYTESEKDYSRANNNNSFDEIGYANLQNVCIFSDLQIGDVIPFTTQGKYVPFCDVSKINFSKIIEARNSKKQKN